MIEQVVVELWPLWVALFAVWAAWCARLWWKGGGL